jgi:hypothetical protein
LPGNGIDYPLFTSGYRQVRPLPRSGDACSALYHTIAQSKVAHHSTNERPVPFGHRCDP